MTEQLSNLTEPELNQAWKEKMVEAINEQVNNFEIFSSVELVDDAPGIFREMAIQFDPVTILENDERTLYHVSEIERNWVFQTIFERVGFNPKRPRPVKSYESEDYHQFQSNTDPFNFQEVFVYRTKLSKSNGIFLHQRRNNLDDYTEYFLARKYFKL